LQDGHAVARGAPLSAVEFRPLSVHNGMAPSQQRNKPMAEDKQSIWPLPEFSFVVEFGDGKAAKFQEASGLDTETQPIEFRHGNSPVFAPIKMPGLHKVGDVTLKRGVIASDGDLWDWLNATKLNTVKRRTVVIKLLDATGTAKMVWTLNNAWPTKISGTDLKADGNEIAIESLELAHEGIALVPV
jgi:phage tail-like protein